MAQQAKVGITGVGRVMVVVSDQDRAIEFYVNKLGFEKHADIPYGNGDRWVEVGPAGATTLLALVLPRADSGDRPGGETRIALSTKDADADHAELRARGVDVDEHVARWGDPVPPMFWFRDRDGNSLMVVEQQ